MKKLNSFLLLFAFCFIVPLTSWGQTVTSFILVNADANTDIGPIANYDVIDLENYNHNLNIRATTTGTIDGVFFEFKNINTGATKTKKENVAPYAMFGDKSGNYNSWDNPTQALYRITATPFVGNYGTPSAVLGPEFSIDFWVVYGPDIDGLVEDITGDNHSVFLLRPKNFTASPPNRGITQLRFGNKWHRIGVNNDDGMFFNDATRITFQVGDTASPTPFKRVMVVTEEGVGINITNNQIDAKLTVNGRIHASEVLVDLNFLAPDYVFEQNYPMPDLGELESYIQTHKHLPGIPSGREMKRDGVDVATMQMKLLEKIEELTLIIIEQNKRLEELERK